MSPSPPRRSRERGFTMLETTISLFIVSVMLLAALGTVHATHRMREIGYDNPRANLLAHDLMAEILLVPSYDEPFEVVGFGPEGAEAASGRPSFDDVDDYHGWTRSPPEARDGSSLPGLVGWTRSAMVAFGDPNDLTAVSGSGDVGVKVVTVSVSRHGKQLASLTAVRTESWKVLPQ